MAAAGLGLAALALAGLAGGARADGHCGNATMASVAQSVPDLSAPVGVVTSVSEDASQAKTAEPFLEAIQDPSTANVTAFAPVNSAFEPLANATYNAAEVLMFHAVAEAMEEGEGYDTLAGAAAGQLTINGDEVEGPCNTAKVLQSVDVCDSVVHVVDKVLLPAEFCAGASEEDTSKEDYAEESTTTPRRTAASRARTTPATTRMTPGTTAARRAPMTAATTATARTPTEVLPASPGPLARRGRPPPTAFEPFCLSCFLVSCNLVAVFKK